MVCIKLLTHAFPLTCVRLSGYSYLWTAFVYLGRVVFRFNLGSGEAVLRSPSSIEAAGNSVIAVEFGHNHTEGYLTVSSQPTITGSSPGHLTNMNAQTMLYVGAVDEEITDLPDELPQYQQFVGES